MQKRKLLNKYLTKKEFVMIIIISIKSFSTKRPFFLKFENLNCDYHLQISILNSLASTILLNYRKIEFFLSTEAFI